MHRNNTKQTHQVAFVYLFAYVCDKNKKSSQILEEESIKGFGGKKGKEKII